VNDAGDRRLTARAVAHGRVQGVFYRDTVRRAALEHGVCGSAVNRPDGAVEMLLEGDRAAIDAVLDVAREGSRAAVVDALSVEWIEPAGARSFEIG
jgi:acylphosphatase